MSRRGYESDMDGCADDEGLQRLIIDRLENDQAFWMARGRIGRPDDLALCGLGVTPDEERREGRDVANTPNA